MRFFEFTPEYTAWFRDFVGSKHVYDIGCGEGHTVKSISDAGLAVTGIEMREDVVDPDHARAGLNIISMPVEKLLPVLGARNALPVFFRPCHGGWVASVIKASYRTGPWLWVGKPENLYSDIEDDFWVQSTDAPRGPEGEVTLLIARYEPEPVETMRFHLVESSSYGTDKKHVLWRYCANALGGRGEQVDPSTPGAYWVNSNGGGCGVDPSDVILDVCDVESEDALDWSVTTVYAELVENNDREGLFTGWLSPSGELHRCKYHEHDSYAYYVLNKEVNVLERLGWARVMSSLGGDGEPFASLRSIDDDLTEAQAERMLALLDEWKRWNAG